MDNIKGIFSTLRRKLNSRKLVCIHIIMSENNSYEGVILNKRKDELNLHKSFSCQSPDEILGLLETNRIEDVILLFSGDGVVEKSINGTFTPSGTLGNLLPGSNNEDFYYIISEINNPKRANLIRQSTVNNQINLINSSGIILLDIQIGSSIETTKISFLNSNDIKIICGNTYEIEGKKINENQTLALIAGLHYFSNAAEQSNIHENNLILHGKEETKFRMLFEKFSKPAAVLFIILCVIAKAITSIYSTKLEEMESGFAFSNSVYENVQIQKEQLEKIEILYDSATLKSASSFAEIAYSIGELVPKEISFEIFAIKPKSKNASRNQEITFDSTSIIIEGSTNSIEKLNHFVDDLKELRFIKEVKVDKIQQSKKSNGNLFSLHLIMI